jgi:hypothetical protein
MKGCRAAGARAGGPQEDQGGPVHNLPVGVWVCGRVCDTADVTQCVCGCVLRCVCLSVRVCV